MNDKRKAIVARLENIAARTGGRNTPSALVEDARSATRPPPGLFDWSDKSAAAKHRLDIARRIIRSVRVEVHTSITDISVPSYIRDPRLSESEQGYCPTVSIKDDATMASDVLQRELTAMIGLLTRSYGIAEVIGVSAEMSTILHRTRLLRELLVERAASRKNAGKAASAAVPAGELGRHWRGLVESRLVLAWRGW